VSRNDGAHVFATTQAEHNRNVEEYQRKYFRDRRRQRR
jgi:cell division protein YceG involved in septum cleavage